MKNNYKKGQDVLDDGLGNPQENSNGQPDKEAEVSSYISQLANKDLVKSSIQVVADPYSASQPDSAPYPLLNRNNKQIGGTYAGKFNLDSGVTEQYSLAYGNKWLNMFDSAMLRIECNYLYIPPVINPNGKQGQGIINGLVSTLADIESILNSTTFTAQAINNYVIVTDQPTSENVKTEVVNEGTTQVPNNVTYIKDFPNVLTGIALYYQKFLQNVLLSFNNFNGYKLKWGPMMRMEYMRHTANLNDLFGMYTKNAFNTLWWTIAKEIRGEYIDTNWMVQTNTAFLTPSRKANDVNNPLVELVGSIRMPNRFQMFIDSGTVKTKVFDSNSFKQVINGVEYNHQTLFERLNVLLSAESTLLWARNYNDSESAETVNTTTLDRFNEVVAILKTVQKWLSSLKSSFADFKSALGVLNRSGVNKWRRNYVPRLTRQKDSITMNNLTVNDIVSLALVGSDKLYYNQSTMRFRSYSLWNRYRGIPQYDAKSGGAFLTLSLKTIDGYQESFSQLTKYSPIGIQLDSTADAYMYLVNRRGKEIKLVTGTSLFKNNVETIHLIPLIVQDSLSFRYPELKPGQTLTAEEKSCYIKTAYSLFDIFKVDNKFYVNPDTFAVYEFEINNFSNEIVNFSRSAGPFWTEEDETKFGFLGLVSKTSKKK